MQKFQVIGFSALSDIALEIHVECDDYTFVCLRCRLAAEDGSRTFEAFDSNEAKRHVLAHADARHRVDDAIARIEKLEKESYGSM